jgi:hypothetical protein
MHANLDVPGRGGLHRLRPRRRREPRHGGKPWRRFWAVVGLLTGAALLVPGAVKAGAAASIPPPKLPPLYVEITTSPPAPRGTAVGAAPLPVDFGWKLYGSPVPPYTFSWTFGDGAKSNASAPSHWYMKPKSKETQTSYTATLKITDATGRTAENSVHILVLGPGQSVVTFLTATPNPLCPPPGPVNFTARANLPAKSKISSKGVAWTMKVYKNGVLQETKTANTGAVGLWPPSIAFPDPGTYEVWVGIVVPDRNSDGSDYGSASTTVVVKPASACQPSSPSPKPTPTPTPAPTATPTPTSTP